MTEEKKAVELTEEEIQSVDGGSGVYNKKVMGISKTCGACVHMITESGWHLCEARNE